MCVSQVGKCSVTHSEMFYPRHCAKLKGSRETEIPEIPETCLKCCLLKYVTKEEQSVLTNRQHGDTIDY